MTRRNIYTVGKCYAVLSLRMDTLRLYMEIGQKPFAEKVNECTERLKVA